MNRIYRRLWSRARQCWVVASELAPSRGKASSTVRAGSLVLLSLLVVPAAGAREDDEDDTAWWARQTMSAFVATAGDSGRAFETRAVNRGDVYSNTSRGNWSVIDGKESMALGSEARASGEHSLAAGISSRAAGARSVTLGSLSEAWGDNSIALGHYAVTKNGGYGTAVGTYSEANGIGATALGQNAKARTENSIAVGSGSMTDAGVGVSKIAIGGNAYAGSSGWTGAIALGGESLAEYDGVAVGYGAKTWANGTVALGRGSLATEANTVSVGSASVKRRVVNVADARLNSTSSDAVTGKQLYATNSNVTKAQTAADGAKTTATAAQSTANTANSNANSALAKANAVSGLVSQVSAAGNVRLGGENTGTVLDVRNKSNAVRSITGLKDGALSTSSTEAVTGKQLNATNTNVTSAKTAADAAKTTATAAQTTATTANTNANTALAKANAVSSLVSQVSASGNVRLGGENTGTVLDVRNKSNAVRSITGLKDGALSTTSTEAVTGKQLNATNANVSKAQAAADATAARLNASAVALGAGAVAEQASYGISTALGNNAKAYNGKSVAMGADARATVDDAGNKISGNAGVSIGAGTRSGNGAVALGLDAVATGDRGVAVGHEASGKGTHATALGFQSNASANQATAVGRGAVASSLYASALGNQASAKAQSALALGDRANAAHAGAVALGNGSATTGTNQVSVGNDSLKRKVVNVADAALSTSSSEAVTGKQLHATNTSVAAVKATADGAQARVAVLDGLVGQVSASGNVRLGADNTGTVVDVANKSGAKRKLQNLANGVLSASSTDAVTGQQLNATNSEVASVRTAATAAKTAADAARGVADGAVQKADVLGGLVGQVSASGNVRLGAENTGTIVDVANKSGGKRRIYNIANGTLSTGSTDAVTGQQLFATNATVETQRQDLAGHAQQLADQDGRITDNRVELDTLRADFDNFDPDLDGVVKFSADRLLVDMEGARVSGVAAGDISSSASTDAVNGGQLFATNVRVSELERKGRFLSVGYDDESIDADAGLLGVALGDSAKASLGSEGGVAIGSFAAANALNSVALGRGAVVAESAESGFALGVGSNVYAKEGVAFGALSRVVAGADGAVALGSYSIATEANTVSVGNGSVKRRLVNLDRGISDHDATTIAQLNEALAGLGGGAGLDAFGNVVGPTYSVQGGKQNNVGDALAALDGAVVRSDSRVDGLEGQLRATFQQSPSTRLDGVGQLNLAGAQGMVLSNLADGRIAAGSRDAVTGNQLHAAEQKIEHNRRDIDAMRRDWRLDQRNLLTEISDGALIDFGGARLIGVADARLSADSSDVVRGSQLFETNQRLNDMEGKDRFVSIGSGGEQNAASAGAFSVAVGDSAMAAKGNEGGVAIGAYAYAGGMNSIALGRAASIRDGVNDGFAVGTRSLVEADASMAIGAESRVSAGAKYSVALGSLSVADEFGTVSVGHATFQRRLVNVANGRNTNDAATIGQLRGALSTLGGNIDANGNVTTSGFTVQGQHQSTVNDALTTLDSAVVTTGSRMDRVETQLRSVFQEAPSTRSDGSAQLTLAGANGMVISNVANGLIAAGSREAVNGGQLHAVQQQLNGRMDGLEQRVDGQPQSRALATASAAPTEQVTPTPEASDSPQVASAGEGTSPTPQPKSKKDDTPSPTPQVDTAELEKMLARANEYTDGAISNFERRLDKMDKRFNRMAAMSSAQTAMAMNTAGLATYNRLGAGVGYAEGESAMAVGYQRVLNEKGSATFSLNGAFTNSGERSMGVGVGIGW
ncbi:hemagluttinin domain-containing protein [Stenotrophomonas maltophilia]|uniref:ESPR-type extended signal peptide-containing protein n=1 Tax=Stenotrophomonas geniculata TaxID=86188 RepID=UPI000ACC2A0F|nr:hemagluttinin domain-containing protein [Stenotrophomonas maltophilia]RRU08264.1 hemagluttinin domain-containing protein [Stenotrophomonas maltophilia]RRU26446.1 hemagluttinin domain-containing protein [Stenotrophomonas maltophilia]RRU79834.1 hemagluttinin domain-containing protein [Stenotrophomonas maltophilia]RRU90161.1 hemagluttinin domain-containing protein [Stenotrophomonas maltophilia]